jgi:hypothetical protein
MRLLPVIVGVRDDPRWAGVPWRLENATIRTEECSVVHDTVLVVCARQKAGLSDIEVRARLVGTSWRSEGETMDQEGVRNSRRVARDGIAQNGKGIGRHERRSRRVEGDAKRLSEEVVESFGRDPTGPAGDIRRMSIDGTSGMHTIRHL